MFGSIGMPELVIILVIALIIFGPRKLPELGRSLGQSIGEFKKASNELRSTLEEEIRVEEHEGIARRHAGGTELRGRRRLGDAAHPDAGREPGARHHAGGRDGQPYPEHRHHRVSRAAWPWCRFPVRRRNRSPDDDLDPDRDDELESEDAGGKMSFLEHLDELRRRIIYAVIALAVGFVICCFFIQQIFDFIMRPMQQLLPAGGTLVYTDPTEAFILYIKIAAIGGLLLVLARRSSRSCGCSSRRGCTRTRRSGRSPSW